MVGEISDWHSNETVGSQPTGGSLSSRPDWRPSETVGSQPTGGRPTSKGPSNLALETRNTFQSVNAGFPLNSSSRSDSATESSAFSTYASLSPISSLRSNPAYGSTASIATTVSTLTPPTSTQHNSLSQQRTREPDMPHFSHRKEQTKPIKKATAAHLNIASLNMKGRGFLTGLVNNKWSALRSDIIKENIGLMAVQETHLSEEHIETLKRLHGNSLEIFNSSDPENPTGKGGVAFVLNRRKTNIKNVKTYEVIKGRALLLQYTWHNSKILTVLAIYAPNDITENKDFWNELLLKWRELRLPRLDILLGDFNIVEDAIDRLPCHTRDT